MTDVRMIDDRMTYGRGIGRWKSWLVLGLLYAAVRGLVLILALSGFGPLGDLQTDPDSYRNIAETLAVEGVYGITGGDGRVDPTAFRPPAYPWLLSWLVVGGELSIGGVALLHGCLGVLTALGVALVIRREVVWLRGESRGAMGWGGLAGMLVAVDPLLVQSSTLVMTETLAAALAVGVWVVVSLAEEVVGRGGARVRAWQWRTLSMLLGGLLAVAVLSRPVFAVWGIWLLGSLVWWGWRGGGSQRERGLSWSGDVSDRPFGWMAIWTGTVLLLSVGLWMDRNRRVVGSPVWATSHGGYTLLLGNNPYYYDYLDKVSFWEVVSGEVPWDPADFHREWGVKLSRMRVSASDGVSAPPAARGVEKAGRGQGSDQLSWRKNGRGQGSDNGGWGYGERGVLGGFGLFAAFGVNGEVEARDGELAEDALAKEWAMETIRSRPGSFVYSSFVRVISLWTPAPQVGGTLLAQGGGGGWQQRLGVVWLRWGLGGYYSVVTILVVVALFRWLPWLVRLRWIAVLGLALALTAVHAVYWSNARMRAPVQPMLLGLAVLGAVPRRSPSADS